MILEEEYRYMKIKLIKKFTLTWRLLMSLPKDLWDGEDSGRHAGGLSVAGGQHPDRVSVRVHQLPGHQQPLHPQKSPEGETCQITLQSFALKGLSII